MQGEGLLFPVSRVNARPVPANVRFRDVNPDYTLNTHPLLTSEQISVRHQIKNVLTTPLNSEEYEPSYGSYVPFRVMDPINAKSAYLLETDVLNALTVWLRDRIVVSVNLLKAIPLDGEDGYRINIPYASLVSGAVDLFEFEVLR